MKQIGRYEIIEELGQGAMGAVYKARDAMMDRVVAVKTILASALSGPMAGDYRERFFREARAAGRLAHPGIVTMFDVSEEEGTPFLVMEFIEGQSLEKILESGERFDAERVMELGQQIAEALDYAHRAGVVHRDIKPANIMVSSDGRLKITDFGVAKLTAAQMTSTGQLMGTPAFMAPEQFTGAPIDGRADLFALGVLLYWLATGDRPFTGETLMAMSYKIVHTEPVPPRKINPAIPRDLENVILKCMEKDPAARYLNGEALARDLRAVREGRSLDKLHRERAGRESEKTTLSAKQPMPSEEAAEDMDTAETVAVQQPKSRTGGPTASAQRKPQATVAAPLATASATPNAGPRSSWQVWLMISALVIIAVGVTGVMKRRESVSVLPTGQIQQQTTSVPQSGNSTASGQLPAPPAQPTAPPDINKVQEGVAKAAKAAEETKKESARIAAEIKKQAGEQRSSGLKLEFSATERTNVVLTEDTKPPAAYQLQPGTSVTAIAENEMKVVTDNAGALQWKLNGKPQSALGTGHTGVTARITGAGAEILWSGDPSAISKRLGKAFGPGKASDAASAPGAASVVDAARIRNDVNQQLRATMAQLKIEVHGVPGILEVDVQMDGKPLFQRAASKQTAAGLEVQRSAGDRWVPPGKHDFEVHVLRREVRARWTQSASGDFVAGQHHVLLVRMMHEGSGIGMQGSRLSVELR